MAYIGRKLGNANSKVTESIHLDNYILDNYISNVTLHNINCGD